jgi:hypothetical protein
MNSKQRRKAKRKVDRLYKQLFGCTKEEFFSGTKTANMLISNGSAGGSKTWQNKTAEQILKEVNEAIKKIDLTEEYFDVNKYMPYYRNIITNRIMPISYMKGV